ncbi:MAG: DUF4157 domain-containing protein, partial [bacterium]|nr:DUF4157 domain-containing protein [bacterium]
MAQTKAFAESETTPASQPMVAKGTEPVEPTTGPRGPVIARSLAALPPPNGKPAPERALQLLSIPGRIGTVGRAGMAAAVQRTVGNSRLSRMVAPPVTGGEEADEEEKLDEELAAGAVQAKLTIGRPGDVYEQEADHVAQRVMRKAQTAAPSTGRVDSPTPLEDEEAIQRCAGCRLGGGCGCGDQVVQRQVDASIPASEPETPVTPTPFPEEEALQPCGGCRLGGGCGEEMVRRQALASNPAASAGTSAIAIPDVGAALSGRVREKVEPVLGADLSGVRVHRSPAAQSAARSLQAKAFTHRNHIWLGPSQSPEDVQLMAHEATHVVQQGAGAPAVQRRPEDYHRAEDGSAPERRLRQAVDREVPEADRQEAGGEGEARDRMRQVDRGELAAQGRQLEPAAQPDVDRPARERTGVEGAARQTESAAKTPGQPVARGAESEAAAAVAAGAGGGVEGGGGGGEAAAEPAPAAGLAESAFALAASIPQPTAASEVVAPEPVVPVDAGGQ